MRVLLVTHETTRSGAPRVALMVGRALLAQGHDVRVAARGPGPVLGEFEGMAPTRVERLFRTRSRLRARRPLRWAAYLVDTAVATLTILGTRPDLVYVNSTAASIYLRPALWLRRPVVLHVHESAAVAAPFLAFARTLSLLARTQLVACSPSVHADLSVMAGLPATDVLLVPSIPDAESIRRLAAEPADLDVDADEVVVGCCGTVEARKGADLLAQAVPLVREATAPRRVRFLWVGDIGDARLADGIPDSTVELVGARSNPYPLMARFDVAVLPSRDDPFPLVVLESMALGVPVVAFDVGGVRQQVGDSGVIVPAGDASALAAALTRLVTDGAERRRLAEAARCRVDEEFSWSAFTAGVEEAVRRGSRS